VRVTGPTTVHVLWRRDYTPLYTLAAAAVAVAAGSVLLVARRRLQAAETAAVEREAEAKPAPAVAPEAAATQPSEEARVISPDELERELEKLAREAEEHREFLERLETLRAEGRISESTYEGLRRERLGMLEALEARVRELENMKKAAAV
jgi:acetoin utilization deacetylase AcuC-like enzyme